MTAVLLVNDYFSYAKESAAYKQSSLNTGLANSVCILMNINKIDAEEAKCRLKNKTIALQTEFLRLRREFEAVNPWFPKSLTCYLDVAMYFHTGVFYWSTFCERHNRLEFWGANSEALNTTDGIIGTKITNTGFSKMERCRGMS
jgi:hypothetical protein